MKENSECKLKDGSSGICKLFNQCGSYIASARIDDPVVCGYKKYVEIICCRKPGENLYFLVLFQTLINSLSEWFHKKEVPGVDSKENLQSLNKFDRAGEKRELKGNVGQEICYTVL